MAHRVVWSPRALADVGAIAEYVAKDSASYASTTRPGRLLVRYLDADRQNWREALVRGHNSKSGNHSIDFRAAFAPGRGDDL